jgi:hypothetical protein
MENLILSLNVIAPLCLLILIGVAINRVGLIGSDGVRQMNAITFRVFLPVLLFNNIYKTTIAEVFDAGLVVYAVVTCLLSFLIGMLLLPKLVKDKAIIGEMIQGSLRSSIVLYGLPVVTGLFGESAAGITALLVALVVPLINVMSVIALQVFTGHESNKHDIILSILKNPLIIGSLGGILFSLTGIRLPAFLETTLNDVGRLATPIALIMLGASFRVSSIAAHFKELAGCVIVKLVAYPLIFLTVAILLGFRGVHLAVLLTLYGSPTASASFAMAQQMTSGDGMLTANIIVFTSVFGTVTMFLFIFVLKSFGFI